MALTIELATQSLLIPHTQSLTIFAPVDTAFTRFGQPSLPVLQYHLIPQAFSYQCLKALPTGAKIPTLLANHTLFITTAQYETQISINNVTVKESPIYNDGSLIIFGINQFFDPPMQFQVPDAPIQNRNSFNQVNNLGCLAPGSSASLELSGSYPFGEACGLMKAKGFSIMASFFDLQFLGLKDQTRLTIFAPLDRAMAKHIGNFTGYSTLVRRHIVPCKFEWTNLENLDDGSALRTTLDGFNLNITRSLESFHVNGVQVILPDLYRSDWLVVHGILEVLELPEPKPEDVVRGGYAFGGFGNNDEAESGLAHYHFSVFKHP